MAVEFISAIRNTGSLNVITYAELHVLLHSDFIKIMENVLHKSIYNFVMVFLYRI